MKINVTMPFDRFAHGDAFQHPEVVSRIAALSEKLGFHSALVTDHPVPTGRWLDAGGHHAHDPFVLLAFIAAATTRLRIQTGILVLPYRNPFITARAVATLDVYSKGRVSLGVGAGYLKGEYKALGVDFDSRNDVMDEYILAMKAAWTQEEFTFSGTGYEALGNRILPLPVQTPHPPILIGGNSKRAIRRAVELGDAWNPYYTTHPTVASTSRTAELRTEDDLAEMIAYMREHCEKVGRATPPAVILASFNTGGPDESDEALIEQASRMKALGVEQVAAAISGSSPEEWCDNAERFAAHILARLD